MDGFDQDEATREGDKGCVTLDGFLAAENDALEALQLADRLLDAGAALVERAWEEAGSIRRIVPMWDYWANSPLAGGGAVGLRIIAFVGQRRTRPDVGTDVQQCLELTAVARLATGQMEGDGQPGEILVENPPRERPSA